MESRADLQRVMFAPKIDWSRQIGQTSLVTLLKMQIGLHHWIALVDYDEGSYIECPNQTSDERDMPSQSSACLLDQCDLCQV
jgi:hypothetical protein